MSEAQFIPNDKGAFAIDENGERIAEMIVGISGSTMSVYHTGVVERLQGQGYGRRLVEAMIQHARDSALKVMIYCPFVKAVFREKEEQYGDIWQKQTTLKDMRN